MLLLALGFVAPASGEPDLLSPERAFRFSARGLGPQKVEARFRIADGYYLYRDKLHFRIEPVGLSLAPPALPPGKVKEDEFFGSVETYRGDIVVTLALAEAKAGDRLAVVAESQGCADAGVCYPPNVQQVTIVLPAAASAPGDFVPPRNSWFN